MIVTSFTVDLIQEKENALKKRLGLSSVLKGSNLICGNILNTLDCPLQLEKKDIN